MREIAEKIFEVIKDYRNDEGIKITTEDIIEWGKQFGDDAEFVLKEFSHIIPTVYISKNRAKEFVLYHIGTLMKLYGYNSLSAFLSETLFIDMQAEYKSQKAILNLMDEVLKDKYGLSYKDYETYPKKNFVYFDDLLATGSTIKKDLIKWLTNESGGIKNYEKVDSNEYRLSVNLFALHTWGKQLTGYALRIECREKKCGNKIIDKINIYSNFEIQNHLFINNQSLNIAIPIKSQSIRVNNYLANLSAERHKEFAYRKNTMPINETFFTSYENRVRYENIILEKGLDIIDMIKGEVKNNIRPLGFIYPSYKTFGLGTHFFTWRNVPNNSPLVFWWKVTGHNWKPLFQLANRGIL